MLGWEWPPELSGGLGRACEALVLALTRAGTSVVFVLPRAPERESGASHARLEEGLELVGCDRLTIARPTQEARAALALGGIPLAHASRFLGSGRLPGALETIGVPSLLRPYDDVDEYQRQRENRAAVAQAALEPATQGARRARDPYGASLFDEIQRYARVVCGLARRDDFDVVHAHDWMTFPAAVALRQLSDRPLIAHVHSTEFDRSPDAQDPTILEIEERGLRAADRVIAVSEFCRERILERYGIPPGRVQVIHPGAPGSVPKREPSPRPDVAEASAPVVLFLGRLTRQKAPEVFLEAAAAVLSTGTAARFVVCGDGSRREALRDRARELGIDGDVEWRGFVDPERVDEAYEEADLFVLPSAAEPFGLVALEAARHGVPVILSDRTGAAEVLRHGLSFESGNADQLADRILACLRFPALRQVLTRRATKQVDGLTWDEQSRRVRELYATLCG